MTRILRPALLIGAALWPFSRLEAADLHGRVIDRGTLKADGSARGIGGVQVTLYDGAKKIGGAVTNGRGVYRIRKVSIPNVKAVYMVRRWRPEQVLRLYHLSPADTASRDVYLDAAPLEKNPKPPKGKDAKAGTDAKPTGYYPALARGFLNLTRQEAFFRENPEDSAVDLSAFFDARDTSAAYAGAMCEFLWAEFLSQDRPLETRYYLAAALFPLLDSLGWGRLQGMKRYLEVPPETVREVSGGMRDALRDGYGDDPGPGRRMVFDHGEYSHAEGIPHEDAEYWISRVYCNLREVIDDADRLGWEIDPLLMARDAIDRTLEQAQGCD